MSRWLVQLEGEPFDTSEFAFWFPTGDICAVSEGDHTYLTGPVLDGLEHSTTVHETAAIQLEALYAVIHVLDPGVHRPGLGTVWREDDDGQRHGYAFMSGVASGRSKVRASISAVGEDPNLSRDTQAQEMLKASRSDRRLTVALSLLAIPNASWPHLYRTLEEIESFLGRKVSAAGICSDNERERFTRSANSAEVAGNHARHRFGKFVPPENPMSLNEAGSFMRLLVQTALRAVRDAA